MKKANEDQVKPERNTRAEKHEVQSLYSNLSGDTVLPVNYAAIQVVSWLTTDCSNTQNLANTIFRGGINTSDQKYTDIVDATNNSVKEMENDILTIKEFLKPLTKKS